MSLWVAVSIVFLLTTATIGDFVAEKLANLENQGAEVRSSKVVGEIEVGVTSEQVAGGVTLTDFAAARELSLPELLKLNPNRSPREQLPNRARITIRPGEWLSSIAVNNRVVRSEDVERGVKLLRERNPQIDFPELRGRPYAPAGTVLTLRKGITVSELAYVQRIKAEDIIEVNPPGSPANPSGDLSAHTVLHHGDPLTTPTTRITAAAIRHRLGIDQTLGRQYVEYLSNVVRFDYQSSLQSGESSLKLVARARARALPRTVQLNLFALILALAIGLPLGLLARGRVGWPASALGRSIGALMVVAPSFWIALLLLGAATPHGFLGDGLWNVLVTDPAAQAITDSPVQFLALYGIPAFCGALLLAGAIAVAMRSAQGSKPGDTSGRSIPDILLRTLRTYLPIFLGLNLVLELVFNIQGLGLLLIQRIYQADMPVVTAICVVTSLFVVWCFFMIDSAQRVLAWRAGQT